jgi:uncharacterized membrane protein
MNTDPGSHGQDMVYWPAMSAPRAGLARRSLLTAAVCGVVAGSAAAFLVPGVLVPMVLWDVSAAVYLALTWARLGRLDAAETARHVRDDDPSRAGTDLILLIAAVVSLAAVGLVLVAASSSNGSGQGLEVGSGVLSVVLSWATVHTVFAVRYAHLYYSDDEGRGVDFNQHDRPKFTDFAYLAFTVGMTFQVSDTTLQTSAIRSTVLRQALLSYLFGTVIVALTINLVAGLSK